MVKFISVQRMLYDNVVEEMKRNGMLRELAKTDEIIWQQMTFDHFRDFLKQGLYFKQYYKLIEDNKKQEREFKRYRGVEDYSKQLYISSWYNAEQLSNIVFKTYSQSGVAIGFRIEDMKRVLNKNDNTFYMGNVQYVSDKYLDSKDKKIFSKYQKIAPVFMKPTHCSADKEFRICWEDESDRTSDNIEKCLNVVNALINCEFYIATDGTITDKKINNCLNNVFDLNYINERITVKIAEKIKLDGFFVYKIEEKSDEGDARMLNNENGFSINFDSVQQRRALLSENGYLSYICMRAIMRLEILLSKKIIFTDAQIYDGLFFFWMTEVIENKIVSEFEEFISCGAKYNFLQIKNRNAKKEFPGDMFSKPFLCSAIELKELSDCILQITSNFITEDDIKELPNELKETLKSRCIKQGTFTLDNYLSQIDKSINKTSVLYNEWNQYKERLKEIDGVLSNYKGIFSEWDNSRYHPIRFLAGKANPDEKSCKEELLDCVKGLMTEANNGDRIFLDLMKELERMDPKRSNFVRICKEIIEQCTGSEAIYEQIIAVMKQYDLYYNQAIAYQHECNNIFDINRLPNEKHVTELPLSKGVLWKLAHISWEEFGKFYSNFTFDDKMENNIRQLQVQLNMENEVLETKIKDGPWNYCETDNYKDKKISASDMNFIDGTGAACDELYVWNSNGETKPYKPLYTIKLKD